MAVEINRGTGVETATIDNGQTTSGKIDIRYRAGGSFQIPAAFTGASVSFLGSNDDVTYTAVHDSTNTVISQTVTASKGYAFPASVMQFRFIKIVSASAEGAARSIVCGFKG